MTDGSHSLSRTSCIGKTPSIYRHNMALPGGSGLDGAPCERAAWQRAPGLESGRRETDPQGCLLPLRAWQLGFMGASASDLPRPSCSPWPRGSRVPSSPALQRLQR